MYLYLSAVCLQHNVLGLGLALGIGHGVLHVVRCVFVAPADTDEVSRSLQGESEQSFPDMTERNVIEDAKWKSGARRGKVQTALVPSSSWHLKGST